MPIYLSLLLNTKVIDPSFQMEKLKALDKKTPHETSWVPIVWAINLLTSADNSDKHSLRIESPVFANLLKGIDKIEANNRKLLNYGWVNFPLAYTQVIMTSHFTFGTTGIMIPIKTHQKLVSNFTAAKACHCTLLPYFGHSVISFYCVWSRLTSTPMFDFSLQ